MNNPVYIDIIEDNEIVVKTLTKMFEQMGNIQSTGFSTLTEALKIEHPKPDIIILDHFLKEEKGIDNIPLLRKNNPNVNIVVLSSQMDVEKMKEAFDLGANEYFKKESIAYLHVKQYVGNFIQNRN